jgi:hypothetical protein
LARRNPSLAVVSNYGGGHRSISFFIAFNAAGIEIVATTPLGTLGLISRDASVP